MIKLPKKHLDRLKEILLNIYGVELTDDETELAAERILEAIVLLGKRDV